MSTARIPSTFNDLLSLQILGLSICADSLIGNDMARGISGGQKKRVTLGELLIGPARVLFMDEISTGLDSSTAFQIVNFLRQSVHILGETAVISLLQPSHEMYDLFDDVILLSEGHVVYQGPKENVTSRKDQQKYWSREDEPYKYFTVEHFSEAFHAGQTIMKVLEVPFEMNLVSLAALKTTKYGVRKRQLVKAIFAREILLFRRNPSVCILAVKASVAMTVFWHSNMHHDSVKDGGIYLGVLFFSVSETMFNNMCDLGGTIMKLPLFFKQRDVFYPAWMYTLSTWILKIPITLIEVTIWVIMTYYPVGFDLNIKRFIKHYLLLLAVSQMSSSLFRLIAGVTRNMFAAKIFGTFAMLLLLLLSGFVISSENINKFWMFGYWISPLMYAQNAISTNEFTAHSWIKYIYYLHISNILPGSSESLGIRVLKTRGLFVQTKWYWIGLGALVGYIFLFNCLYTVALTCFKRAEKAPKSRRVTLSFVPLTLTFDNIRYSVDMPKETKVCAGTKDRLEILKGVSGAFRPGVLTALMGVSGAGKTTLMDVLAGRKTGGHTEGAIYISGYPKKQETFFRVFGYCEQSNIHSPHLTVLESLMFSAWLRLPSEIDSMTRKMFVEDVIELLELTSLQDAHVGLAGTKGLSSEQQRRLTIAVELVANPSIIFMDEPTSGLDSRGAAIVMRTVRNLVDTGKTVVCTIHQPSIDIFETRNLILLVKNMQSIGLCNGTLNELQLFLLNRGGEEIYVGPLGSHSSELIKYFEGIERVNRIKDGYNPATWMLEVTSTVQEQILEIDFSQIYKNSGLYQTKPQDLFNSMGSIYSAVLMLGIQNACGIQPVVAMERIVFYRERASGMYSALPYAFAQVTIELLYIFVQTLIYGVLVYTMIGFEWTVAKFFWYIFFMSFTLLYFTFFGMMTVGLTPNGGIAAVLSAAFYGFWNLFAGFLIPRIPIWWRWYNWISPVAWTLCGLGASQFGDVEEKLDTGETVAEFMRSYYGFKHEYLEAVTTVIMAYSVAFAVVFGFSLKYINFQKR
uniref:ABC transporter domain-containing protein n=1 Tax=Leersia perrieri TaxID=77586 RepID=A0A0D9V1K1_9ORYZ